MSTRTIRIKNWSHQKWLDFRSQGIGGSEVATVMAIENPDLASTIHSDPIKLWLEKIGEPVPLFTGNRFTGFGHIMEPVIADNYKYWDYNDPKVETMLMNREQKRKLNKVRDIKSYLVNSKYPHLFASIDRLIISSLGPNILECKNTTFFEMERYENGISPSFYLQVMMYLMMYEKAKYADIAIQYDGNNMKVVRIYPNAEHMRAIDETTGRFWIQVLKARQIKLEYGIESYYGQPFERFTEKQQDGILILIAMEPDLVGGAHELAFVKSMIKPRPEETERPISPKAFEAAKVIQGINKDAKEADIIKDKCKSEILIELNGHTKMTATEGYISNKVNAKGVARLYISPKLFFDH
ncbi:MAG: YqaJ viral recombinase family protein [Candidatus Njordarchaeales archaeon]